SSLAKLLNQERGVRNIGNLPDFTESVILQWAREHFAQAGKWPTRYSGKVLSNPEENWRGVENALRVGLRGLPGGSSLAQLLEAKCNVPNRMNLRKLSRRLIVTLAKEFFEKPGSWPTTDSGDVDGVEALTWNAVDQALRKGSRGLPGGSSLA